MADLEALREEAGREPADALRQALLDVVGLFTPNGYLFAAGEHQVAVVERARALLDQVAAFAAQPKPVVAVERASDTTVTYVLGLLAEEGGEISQWVGKALRFGIDTPGRLDANGKVSGETPRTLLPDELGDMLAAVQFALAHGVFNRAKVFDARDRKLAKLLNPAARDNLGRQLAPQPALRAPASAAEGAHHV